MDVSEIAQSFNGGGHVRAAGCTIYDSIENAKETGIRSCIKNNVR